VDIIVAYLSKSSAITILVIAILSIYFLLALYIFIYRYRVVNSWLKMEKIALNTLLKSPNSITKMKGGSFIVTNYLRYGNRRDPTSIIKPIVSKAMQNTTKGLTALSIMATTSPFIGLFGTVIGILEAFSKLGNTKSASLNVVAPAISEALIATAIGIFVAIFAYSFSLILKRKIYELSSTIESISSLISKESGVY
jgi:biopolymer transport protein ExbB/TolQ